MFKFRWYNRVFKVVYCHYLSRYLNTYGPWIDLNLFCTVFTFFKSYLSLTELRSGRGNKYIID